MKIVCFLSSTRRGTSITGEGSLGNPIGNHIAKLLEEEGHDVSVWDPKLMNFPLLEQPLYMTQDKAQFPEWLMEANRELEGADSYIVISAEYHASIPPALTNMLNHFSPGVFRHKPCGIVTYSSTDLGGRRVHGPLKTYLCELGMVIQPCVVSAPNAAALFDKDGDCINDRFKCKVKDLLRETQWYGEALGNQLREKEKPTVSRF